MVTTLLILMSAHATSAPAAANLDQASPAPVTLRVNPARVCLNERHPHYLNFDLLVANRSASELIIREVRGLVLRRGEVLERRILWSQALDLLGPARTLAPGSESLLFNPFVFNALARGAQVRVEVEFERADTRPASVLITPQPCPTRARLTSPIAGRILVMDGYDFLSHHRRTEYLHPNWQALGVTDNPQRHGLDLVVVDPEGRTFRGSGSRNEDWLGWDQPVRAPAAGLVAAVHDGQPDNSEIGSENLWTERSLSRNEMSPSGNYVLIDHGHGEYSLLSHLRNGSVRVRAGERVRAGQLVARVGNSGASLMPHVHYELRSGWGLRGVTTMPAYFRDVTVLGTGERASPRGIPLDTGDIVIAR